MEYEDDPQWFDNLLWATIYKELSEADKQNLEAYSDDLANDHIDDGRVQILLKLLLE